MTKVAVIVPGAGSGTRFGAGKNKIFAEIKGKPIFLRTLETFSSRQDVCQVIFVCSKTDESEIRSQFGPALDLLNVQIVLGGDTRSQSVRNALAAVDPTADLVAIHDAARPCVSQTSLTSVFAEAAKSKAAILANPIFGTVKRVSDESVIESTLPRDQYHNLYEAQTPQAFDRQLITDAYAHGDSATDCAALVEKSGTKVSVVPGDPRNVKITTQSDLDFATAIINTI